MKIQNQHDALPPDAYNELRVELPSTRLMVVIVPDGMDATDLQKAIEELEGIADVLAGLLPA